MSRRCDPPQIRPDDVPIGTPKRRCGNLTDRSGFKLCLIVSLNLFLLTGCYAYTESSLASLSPGLQARVTLTEDGFGRVVNQAAVEGVPIDMLDMSRRGVVGRVRDLGPGNLTVELRGGGASVFTADVPVQAIEDVAVRTFSRSRTIAAAVGVAVLFAGAYAGTVGGTTSPPLPPEPEQLVFPSTRVSGVSSPPRSLGRFHVFSARLAFSR